MATMVKEKKRDKRKKPKEYSDVPCPSIKFAPETVENQETNVKIDTLQSSHEQNPIESASVEHLTKDTVCVETSKSNTVVPDQNLQEITPKVVEFSDETPSELANSISNVLEKQSNIVNDTITDVTQKQSVNYEKLNTKLDIINMQYKLKQNMATENVEENISEIHTESTEVIEPNIEDGAPSAPVFDFVEMPTSQLLETAPQVLDSLQDLLPKLECMPLEEALRLYGGVTITEVRGMSEREEMLVEAGPDCGPEHPLVDLLLTFRQSLTSLERERIKLAQTYTEAERYRETLWKVEKCHTTAAEKCACGATVQIQASYETAELLKNKIPIAKMKLKGLLNDAQDCYCHHQHAALLAHYQIEEFVAHAAQSNKKEIRTALSLLLQELRVSGSETGVLTASLQRWARELASSLVDARDIRQLLFLLHHLFRQTRSVHWAAPLVTLPANDSVDAARVVAVLELILCGQTIDTATECIEECSEVWEEVDRRGTCAAVSDGALRERDVTALVRALPLQELVKRMALLRARDITQTSSDSWLDKSGGRGVLKCVCGARWLLAVLSRGLARHPHYSGLADVLANLAELTVHSITDLHLHTSLYYDPDLVPQITAELEALFSVCHVVFTRARLPHSRLPYRMLSERAAMAYCMGYMIHLHETTSKPIDGVDASIPGEVSCCERVRTLSKIAVDRITDNDVARNVLEFLFQMGIKRKSNPCKDECESAARECISEVLEAHPYLYPTALYIMADFCEADRSDSSSLKWLQMDMWRPAPQEVIAVLSDWKKRCPKLLPHLLLSMNYSPKSGVSLPSQESILWWCVEEAGATGGEWVWGVLRVLRTHRAWWGEGAVTSPPLPPDTLLRHAYNLLNTEHGHSVPLICEQGVSSLLALCCAGRVKDAVHCLGPAIVTLAQSPESISLTPKFKELITQLVAFGPTLVQRALGRGGDSGSDLLHRLLVSQLTHTQQFAGVCAGAVCGAWLHLVCASETATLAETAVCATRDWACLDAFVSYIMQDSSSQQRLKSILAAAARCPTIAEAILRAKSYEQRDLTARLGDVLHGQRSSGARIHVDNALQSIGARILSEDLVIHQCAAAALVAPFTSPSHLTLWRMFIHLYLQRPHCDMRESTSPLGPLFFSGLIKSRVLSQIKKRLLETANHHRDAAEQLKYDIKNATKQKKPNTGERVRVKKRIKEKEFIPKLSMSDLTGESSESGESCSSGEESEREVDDEFDVYEQSRDAGNMLCYHEAAEKLSKTYLGWLEQGDTVQAMDHQADISRFIIQQAMEEAWKRGLEKLITLIPDDEEPSKVMKHTQIIVETPLQRAVARILKYKTSRRRRSRNRSIMSPIDEIKSSDRRTLLALLDKKLKQMEALAHEWEGEISRVCALDSCVWELVSGLRSPAPLPPVSKSCANKCAPISIRIQAEEWRISTRAENSIKENRASALAALRKLIRARPHIAETAAAIQTIARYVQDTDTATVLLERAWRSTNNPYVDSCPCVKDALLTLFTQLAQKWICHSGVQSARLISQFCSSDVSLCGIRQKLIAALVWPAAVPWYPLYRTLLTVSLPPDAAFSYLSKFEMSRLSGTLSSAERRELFDTLLEVVQRYSLNTDSEYKMLIELLSVHISNVIEATFIQHVCSKCAKAATTCTIPPAVFTHVHSALYKCLEQVTFDELGHSLRSLGAIWWEVRTNKQTEKRESYSDYGSHIAVLVCTLVRGLVNAAQELSYSEERVSWYAWGAMIEAISPWIGVQPPAPPLQPPHSSHAVDLCKIIGHELRSLVRDSGLISLLHHIWEWCVQQICTLERPNSECTDQDRTQLANILAEVTDLPWEQQWFSVKCMPGLVQLCSITSSSSRQWCMVTVRAVSPDRWMCDITHHHLTQHLATLLYVTTTLPMFEETIANVCMLPWYHLPMAALEHALERFYGEHYSTTVVYHTLPQFSIVLYASELQFDVSETGKAIYLRSGATEKRICSVSFWIRVMSAPALQSHVADSIQMLLDIIRDLAIHLDPESVELDSLLGRAVTILYTEPAAAASIPVLLKFVSSSSPLMLRSCISAIARFTSIQYFAILSDEMIRAYMTHSDTTHWRDISSRWRDCLWYNCKEFCKRGKLHTAYAVIDRANDVREAITALTVLEEFDFVANEVICAVWACVACRVHEDGLLALWAEEPKLSILRTITLHANTDRPTARLRLLSRYALCVLTPDSEPAQRAYEAGCAAVWGSNPGEIATWAREPTIQRLVELAIKLYPKYDNYFDLEKERVQG